MPALKKYGHYQVKAELGRGGMAVVYKCWEESLNRFVAIKVLAEHLVHDKELKARFLREAKSMASINHPNVIQVHFIGEEQGQPFFAMEFIEGKSLSDILKPHTKLSIEHAKNFLYQACEGLLAAHNKGLIHRDIKPGNLMISDDGMLKLVDFGIAHSQDFKKRLTSTGDLVGTPGYLSPESCVGDPIDFRADIYSLGIVFYQMLSGEIPFDNDSPLGMLLEVVESNIVDIRKINKKVDKKTAQLIVKMIARDPDSRYGSCQEIIDLLERPSTNNSIISIIKARSKTSFHYSKPDTESKLTQINKATQPNLSNRQNSKITKVHKIVVASLIILTLFSVVFYGFNNSSKDEIATDNKFVTNGEKPKEQDSLTVDETIVDTSNQDQQEGAQDLLVTEVENCIEVYPFTIKKVKNSLWSLKKAPKPADKLLKSLRQRVVDESAKSIDFFTVYNTDSNKCPDSEDSLSLLMEISEYKKSKKVDDNGVNQDKITVILTLVNKNTQIRLAQKRITDKNISQQLASYEQTQKLGLTAKVNTFIRSAVGL